MRNPSSGQVSIAATLGDVRDSQVAIGEHILQVNARDGAVVKVLAPRRRVRPKPRPLPVLVRPRAVPGFLDRLVESELAHATLRAGATVEVVGETGIGKSALLRHLSHVDLGSALPDGIVHVHAAGRSTEDLLQLIFGHFFDAPGAYRPGEPELRRALRDRRALIVLDDVELQHDELSTLLDALPHCAVVVATASRRGWGESQALLLGGLPPADAAVLLERELGRALGTEERTAAAALCERLQGHPLGLLQAAARAREAGLSLHELDVQATPPAAAETQERRSVLVLLAAAGALDMEALAALAGPHATRTVEALLQLRAVDVHDGAVHALPSGEAEPDREELDDARRRVLAYLLPWAEARRHDTAAIGARAPLLVRTVHAALHAGDAASALRLARAIEPAFMLLGLWGSWRVLIEACAAAGRALGDPGMIEAWALHQLGVLDVARGDAAAAANRFEAAARIRDAVGDATGAAVTRANLGALRGATGISGIRQLAGSGGSLTGAGIAIAGGAALVWLFAFRTPDVRLVASAGDLDFGEQQVGTASGPKEIIITNESDFDVNVDAAVVRHSDFRIVSDACVGTLSARASCTIAAAFTPSGDGYRSARVELNAGRAGVPTIRLAGYGVASQDTGTATVQEPVDTPDTGPTPPDTAMSPPPAAVVAQDVDFGVRELGSITIGAGTLRNVGESAARFGRLELSGDADFRVVDDGCSGRTLQPGEACGIEIAFRPAAAGARTATLAAPGEDGSILSILRISGGATAPPPPPPARILHFEVDAGALRERGELRLCYGVADAVQVRIDPAPGAVQALEKECVGAPPAAGVYTLSAVGADGRRATQRVAVELPAARILRLVASPDSVGPGGRARICYALADAVAAELEPGPQLGTVEARPEHCVVVQPDRTQAYTLRVRGLDGRTAERQVMVTVRQVDTPPPGVPQRLAPGTLEPANPAPQQCPRVAVRWTSVTVPGTPVRYDVLLEQRSRGARWEEIQRTRTDVTTASFENPVGQAMRSGGEGTYVFRWTVRAVDGAGNEGDFAPPRYFSCIVIHERTRS